MEQVFWSSSTYQCHIANWFGLPGGLRGYYKRPVLVKDQTRPYPVGQQYVVEFPPPEAKANLATQKPSPLKGLKRVTPGFTESPPFNVVLPGRV